MLYHVDISTPQDLVHPMCVTHFEPKNLSNWHKGLQRRCCSLFSVFSRMVESMKITTAVALFPSFSFLFSFFALSSPHAGPSVSTLFFSNPAMEMAIG